MPEVPPQPSQPTQPQVQSVQSKGISWKKILVSVAMILVVAGAIAGALYWYFVLNEEETTTEPTKVTTPSAKKATPSAEKEDYCEDGKLYKYTNYGFKICLPVDWKYSKYSELSEALYFAREPMPPMGEISDYLVVGIPNITVEEALETSGVLNHKKGSETETVVDGAKAYQLVGKACLRYCDGSNPYVVSAIRTIFSNNNQTYDIFLVPSKEEKFDKEKEAYDQLISTFKFLD